MLDLAGRLALRGAGRVEPNPLVGSVIASASGEVLGAGHHRVFGGAHAEIEALRACERAGRSARGATAYVTLEPCAHTGKTGPCAVALIEAGVAEVVCAREDRSPDARGGAERLSDAGIPCRFTRASSLAWEVGEPFATRVRLGRPWVIAKWAQTLDGRIATRTGESQWISCPASRRRVHALRGRVDAIVTGIGTVLADDPLLTARGVPARRAAARVVVDPELRTPTSARLLASLEAGGPGLTFVAGAGGASSSAADALRARGAAVVGAPEASGSLSLRPVFESLLAGGVATALVEAGPGLVGRLLAEDLIDEAWVFQAPTLLGDDEAPGPARGIAAPSLADGAPFRLVGVRRSGADALLIARRERGPSG